MRDLYNTKAQEYEKALFEMTAAIGASMGTIPNADKTVIGKIITVYDKKPGTYRVQVENVTFDAITQYNYEYSKDDTVYVTILKGDYSGEKRIVGKVEDLTSELENFYKTNPLKDLVIGAEDSSGCSVGLGATVSNQSFSTAYPTNKNRQIGIEFELQTEPLGAIKIDYNKMTGLLFTLKSGTTAIKPFFISLSELTGNLAYAMEGLPFKVVRDIDTHFDDKGNILSFDKYDVAFINNGAITGGTLTAHIKKFYFGMSADDIAKNTLKVKIGVPAKDANGQETEDIEWSTGSVVQKEVGNIANIGGSQKIHLSLSWQYFDEVKKQIVTFDATAFDNGQEPFANYPQLAANTTITWQKYAERQSEWIDIGEPQSVKTADAYTIEDTYHIAVKPKSGEEGTGYDYDDNYQDYGKLPGQYIEYRAILSFGGIESNTVKFENKFNPTNYIPPVEVGGRNLLLNSSFTENTDKWSVYGNTKIIEIDGVACAHIAGQLDNTSYVYQSILDKIDANNLEQQYVYSADVRIDNYKAGTTSPFVGLYVEGSYYDANGISQRLGVESISGSATIPPHSNKGWVKMAWVFRIPQAPISLNLYMYARDFTGDLYFKNLKLEKGNKATLWSPAPEDPIAYVDTEVGKFDTKVAQLLGLGETVIGDKYVISPYIGGGYLNITKIDLNGKDTYPRVIIDPNGGTKLTQKNSKDEEVPIVFSIQKSANKPVIGLDGDGNAIFDGTVYANAGNIGGCTFDSNGSLIIPQELLTNVINADYIKGLKLEVGDEIIMGEDARISWGQVDNSPTIPDDAYITEITNNTIKTTNVVAQNLQVKGANIDSLAVDKISGGTNNESIIFTGAFTAPNATITGTIRANKGYIGGPDYSWTIDTQKIYYGTFNTENYIGLYSQFDQNNYKIGNVTSNLWRIVAGKNFGVTRDGTLSAANANISGTITASTFKSASDNTSVYLSATALPGQTVGNTSNLGLMLKVGSKFGVTNDGTLYASNANINGLLSAGVNSQIGPWKVTDTGFEEQGNTWVVYVYYNNNYYETEIAVNGFIINKLQVSSGDIIYTTPSSPHNGQIAMPLTPDEFTTEYKIEWPLPGKSITVQGGVIKWSDLFKE